MQERLEALLVAAYDELRADVLGDADRRRQLEQHCERRRRQVHMYMHMYMCMGMCMYMHMCMHMYMWPAGAALRAARWQVHMCMHT